MTRKTEIILAVSVLVLLLLVLGFFLFQATQKDVPDGGDKTPAIVDNTKVPEVPASSIPKNTTVGAATVSKMFVERLGSYSSESGYTNIDDILSLATTGFQSSLKQIAADARRKSSPDDAYYGISTKVISQGVKEETETSAIMNLKTQRSESIGSPANTTVRYQDITVNLSRVGADWKVSGFTWGQ
jgi:hypothetical protein